MRTKIWIAIALGLAIVLAAGISLANLGAAGSGSEAPRDSGTAGNAGGPSRHPPSEPGPQVVKPRPGMVAMQRVPWQKAEVRDDRVVRVFFSSGVEPCHVLDHVDVEYLDREIRITLFEGSDPKAGDVACIEIAVHKAVDVPLAEPVRGRRLVDGSQRTG